MIKVRQSEVEHPIYVYNMFNRIFRYDVFDQHEP